MDPDRENNEVKEQERAHDEIQFLEVSDYVPESYRSNSVRENKMIDLVQNFQQQFKYLYPKRPKPFLCLPNEYGVQKVVCTTVCPTVLPYPELNMWDGCASFIADFLQYEPFPYPTKFPLLLASPDFTLKRRKGYSVNFSVVLCSLLLAAGYDAYVVCGYGTQELCLMDEKLKLCQLLMEKSEESAQAKVKRKCKYLPESPVDLCSDYEKMQHERQVKEEKEKKERELQEKLRQLAEKEKPPPDPMHGQRVHYWILVREKERDIKETIFIEPSTGESRPVSDEQYLGIECLWNHNNFWINKQQMGKNCSAMNFDISDVMCWEPFLPIDQNGIPIIESDPEKEDERKLIVSDMPGSWVLPLSISNDDFEQRYLGGIKVNYYKCVKTEKFSPYLLPNGVILKISVYKDKDYTNLKEMHEHYSNRADKLLVCKVLLEEGKTIEKFQEGRKDCLKELISVTSPHGVIVERIIRYYSSVRADGLSERHITSLRFHEDFHERKDFLSSREVLYQEDMPSEGKDMKDLENPPDIPEEQSDDQNVSNQEGDSAEDPEAIKKDSILNVQIAVNDTAEGSVVNENSLFALNDDEAVVTNENDRKKSTAEDQDKKPKEIVKITETFERNRYVDADNDIEIKTFSLEEDYIRIDFHTADERITSSYLEFIKPPPEKGSEFSFTENMWSGFQADYQAKPHSKLRLYQNLVKLMEDEKKSTENVHKAEDEVERLLEVRQRENDEIRLTVVPYDPTRDNKLQEWRSKQIKMLEKDILWRKRMYDVLTPYLARLDFPEELNLTQAKAIYNECLGNFITRMVTAANNIQKQLNKERSEYRQKSDYLYHHRSHMTKKQKDEYAEYFKKADFKIRALDMMLNRHKESARARYLALEERLKSDPRLAVYAAQCKM